jgi:hypothetical protein
MLHAFLEPRMILCLRSAAALSLLVLGGCQTTASGASPARAADPSLLEISPWQPPAGQVCNVVRPDSLPAFGAVFDSLALVQSSRALRAAGALLVSVRTDSLGLPLSLYRVDTSLPPTEAGVLEDSLLAHFRGGARFGARVRVDVAADGEARFRMGSAQTCEPVQPRVTVHEG